MASQFQLLRDEFNTLLNEYQETYTNYVNVINSNNLTSVSNSAFVGKNTINVISNSTLENCTTSCSSNTSCSGATFNSTLNNCTLSSGKGEIISSTESTAITQEVIYYSYELKKINERLTEINNQMLYLSNKNYGDFQKNQKESENQESDLNNNYNVLKKDRLEIEKMIHQFETINSAYENGNINVTSNYYSYVILVLLAILLIFLLFRFSLPSQLGGSNKQKYTNNTFTRISSFKDLFDLILLPFKLLF